MVVPSAATSSWMFDKALGRVEVAEPKPCRFSAAPLPLRKRFLKRSAKSIGVSDSEKLVAIPLGAIAYVLSLEIFFTPLVQIAGWSRYQPYSDYGLPAFVVHIR